MANWEEVTVDDSAATDVPTASDADLDDASLIFARDGNTLADRTTDEFIAYLNTKALKIVDMSAGLHSLATEALALLYYNKQAGIFNDKLWIVERVVQVTSNATADWTRFTHTDYLGVRPTDPSALGNAGKFYYNEVQHEWREALGSGLNVQWRNTPIELIIDTDHVFVGDYNSEQAAENHITNFTTTKTYLAFFNNRINELTNTTYVAPGSPTYEYHWIRDVSDNRDYAYDWDTNVDYSEGKIVETPDGDYAISKVNDNNGNDPDSDDGTNWYVFGSGGGGLSSVATDSTLDGDGTASDTLGIADDGVDSDQLANDAVTHAKMADNSVAHAQMLNNAVDTPELVNDAVTQAKIANDAVGTAQIEDDAVDSEHIADEAIRDEHVADDLTPTQQSNIRTKIGAGAGTTTNLTEEQVIDRESDVFGQISGREAFHVVRRHAPDVVPARFTTIHRVISTDDQNIDDDAISWDFVTGTTDNYDFYFKEHTDLSTGFFEEIPDGRLIKFIDDTIESEWEGTLVSAEVDEDDSTLHILRVRLTTQLGSFTVGDDMRIEFEYQHSDILDDSIDDTKVDSNMSAAKKENFRDHIGAGLPGEATPAQETTVYENDATTFVSATPQNFTLTAGLDTFDSPGIIQMRFIQDFTDGSTDDDLRGLRAEAEFSLDIIKDLPIIADADFSTTAYENVVVERTIRLGTVDAPGDLQASTVAVGRKSNTELRIAASHALLDGATFEIKIIELKGSKGDLGDGTSVTTDASLKGTGETTDVLGIADDGVDTDQLADDAVTQSKIADNSVGNPSMLSNAIDTAEIVNDAVTQSKLADNAVGNPQIGLHAVETNEIADDAVTAAKIADDAITAAKIANNAVGASEIASLAVGTSELADNAVTTIKIVNDAVNQSKIADDAVGNNQLAANAVNTDQIVDDAVTNAKIAPRAVDTTEVENNAITSVQLADIAVATNKIVDEAVTTAKIDDGAVTQAKLADDAVGSDEIGDGVIREVHIAADMTDTEKDDLIEKLAVWLYDKKGPLLATSSALPVTATDAHIVVTWTIDGDAPTGVAINGNETYRVNLPQTRPYTWCDGLIVEALVGTTVMADMKVTWGPGGAQEDTDEADFSVGALYFANTGLDRPKIDFIYNAHADGPFIELKGDNDTIPANATVEIYLAR